jgi:hypothetical protein
VKVHKLLNSYVTVVLCKYIFYNELRVYNITDGQQLNSSHNDHINVFLILTRRATPGGGVRYHDQKESRSCDSEETVFEFDIRVEVTTSRRQQSCGS